MTRLSRITLEGFRSIHSTTLELGPLNVFIGANGAGKSNFIAFLRLLQDALSDKLQYYVQTSGPASALLHFGPKLTPAIRGTVEFQTDAGRNEYQCTLTYAAGDTLIFRHEEARYYARGDAQPKVFALGVGGHRESGLTMHWDDPTARAMTELMKWLLGNCRVYQFNDTSLESHLRRTPQADDNAYLRHNGGNLASFLLRLRGEYPREFREIERTINMVLPAGEYQLVCPIPGHEQQGMLATLTVVGS